MTGAPKPLLGARAASSDRLRRPAFWLLIALCLETVYAVAYRSVLLAVSSLRLATIAGLFALVLSGVAYALRAPLQRACARVAFWQPGRSWYPGWLALGILLRLAWHLAFHTIPRADGRIYFNQAATLAFQHSYPGAFFPPGLPLFEAPFLMVLGAHVWVAALCTLLCFIGVFFAVRALAREVAGDTVAGIACLLVALWPNDIAAVGVNPKEELLALLLTTSLWLYLRGMRGARHPILSIAAAGLLLGFAALTQPAYLLFPVVLIGIELLWRGLTSAGFLRIVILGALMLAAIAPWSLRNYTVFHRRVLITTNGGSVFYRANNPNANAQYEPEGAQKLTGDEFAASDEGYRAARLWIRTHPLDFVKLMVRKQVVYLGDDSDRVYESIKREQAPRALVYAGLKLVCNGFWMAVFLFLVAASRWMFQPRQWRLWYGLCLLPLVYQWCIDSVFEAGSRHHVPYFGLLSVLVATGVLLAARDVPTAAALHPTIDPSV